MTLRRDRILSDETSRSRDVKRSRREHTSPRESPGRKQIGRLEDRVGRFWENLTKPAADLLGIMFSASGLRSEDLGKGVVPEDEDQAR